MQLYLSRYVLLVHRTCISGGTSLKIKSLKLQVFFLLSVGPLKSIGQNDMIKFVTPEVQGHRKYRLDNQQDLL